MALADKYKDVLDLGVKLGIQGGDWKEEGGKLHVKGTAEYQLQKDQLWDKIKSHAGWENEVAADIKVEKTDIYGVWEVKSGDTLGKIAKSAYDNAGAYMQIFEANRNILSDPNVIKVGQKLVIPNKT
jgi:nucleoid-associated protein YgaU